MNERVALNKRIADKLLDDGLVDETDHARAVEYSRARGKRIEEALLDLEIIDELALLKYIATLHRTQYVSTEKLSKARLDPDAIAAVTKQTARHFGVFPLVLDRKNDKLIVATADPDNPQAQRELSIAAKVEHVAFMVARPAAVHAAIARAYERDKQQFKRLLVAKQSSKLDANLLMYDPFKRAGPARREQRITSRSTSRRRGAGTGEAAGRGERPGEPAAGRRGARHSTGGRPVTMSAIDPGLDRLEPPEAPPGEQAGMSRGFGGVQPGADGAPAAGKSGPTWKPPEPEEWTVHPPDFAGPAPPGGGGRSGQPEAHAFDPRGSGSYPALPGAGQPSPGGGAAGAQVRPQPAPPVPRDLGSSGGWAVPPPGTQQVPRDVGSSGGRPAAPATGPPRDPGGSGGWPAAPSGAVPADPAGSGPWPVVAYPASPAAAPPQPGAAPAHQSDRADRLPPGPVPPAAPYPGPPLPGGSYPAPPAAAFPGPHAGRPLGGLAPGYQAAPGGVAPVAEPLMPPRPVIASPQARGVAPGGQRDALVGMAPRPQPPRSSRPPQPPTAAGSGPGVAASAHGAQTGGELDLGDLADAIFDPFGVLGDEAAGSTPPATPVAGRALARPAGVGGQDGVRRLPSVMPPSALPFGAGARHPVASDMPPPEVVTASGPFLESLRVLVGLLENDREELRGHSTLVARLALGVCERIRLPRKHTGAIVLASYLHDLGKMGPHHLTPLNVAQSEEHRDLAVKLVGIPGQLLESVGLPDPCIAALDSMYEQVNGMGFMQGLQGKEIPIGARILAVADAYADLARSSRNPYCRVLSAEEAVEVLREHAGTVFDPNLVEVFGRATAGESIASELLSHQHRVLVVDPDPEETMVLQLRLVEQGFDVHVARGTGEARAALSAHTFALVLCEVDLEEREAGFHLRAEAAKSSPSTSWVFLTSRGTRTTAQRAFNMDVDDFLAKPVSHDIVVAKVMQLIERRETRVAPRGVSGSLSQMGLPEIVQILWHGRKTCALLITHEAQRGEIHFREGRIVDALFGAERGEMAFYRMIALGERGEFSVDPEYVPQSVTIDASPEALLLEGMRLLDEGLI